MKILRVPVVCLLAAACPKSATVSGPVPEPAALYEMVKKAHAVPATLSCDAKAFVEAPENGGRYALHIAVQRPSSIRIEALTPMGDPAAVLVADQGRFALMDLRNNVFYRGPASARNLSRLIPVPLGASELVSLITGAVPDQSPSPPIDSRREEEGFRLVFGNDFLRVSVVLGADLRVLRFERVAKGTLEYSVSLDEHDDSSGAQVPRLLHLEAPFEKIKVDLRLRSVVAGKPPPAGAFLLGVPQGMRVEEVE